ncbi:hypothetical protein HK102_013908 [Quaeritorhiza haematococci]|nr:hypothetical protein HK102_013908 [Quaeritorhiza haematococci]
MDVKAPALEKKKKAGSRHGKKTWRKNIDLEDVEESLQEVRNEERLGGSVRQKDNASLFVIDTAGDSKIRKVAKSQKKLRLDEILTPSSSIPGVVSRRHPLSSRAIKLLRENGKVKERKISRATQELVNKIVKNKQMAGKSGQGTESKSSSKQMNNKKRKLVDVWETSDMTEESANEYLEHVQPKKPKVRIANPPTQKKITVIPEHAGISYNPTVDDHQDLIKTAVEEELEIQKRKEAVAQKLAYPPELDELEDDYFFDDSDEEEAEEGDSNNAEEVGQVMVKPVLPENRKTKAQRNKEARRLQQEKEERERKEQKQLQKQLNSLPQIRKAVVQKEKEIEERQKQQSTKEPKAPRLGPHKLPHKPMDVQLTEELADSLRTLKPEGNLFTDRFMKLQQQSLIEPRMPVK